MEMVNQIDMRNAEVKDFAEVKQDFFLDSSAVIKRCLKDFIIFH